MEEYTDFFQGWFDATPLEIFECLHEFSNKFIEDEDYFIDTVLNGNIISVTGVVLESITGYDPAYVRPARSYGKLEFLSPIEDNLKPMEFRVLADPGSDEFWTPFLIILRTRFIFLDPNFFPKKPEKHVQPTEPKVQPEDEDIEKTSEPVLPSQRVILIPRSAEAIDRILSNTKKMKEYYKDYTPSTAKAIIDAIPKARNHFERHGGWWGPGIISKTMDKKITPATVSRYLGAIKKAGIEEIPGDGEMIPIPHTSMSPSQ